MKMRMIVRLVAVVAIAAVMMLSSYTVAEQLSQAEEDAVFANATIDTYKYNYTFDMDTTMEMQGNVAGAIDVTMVTNGSYIVNNTNKTMPVKTGNMNIVNMSISRNTTGKIAEIKIVRPETVSVRINDSVYTAVYLWNPKLSELVEVMGSPESYETFWKSQGLLNSSDVKLLEDEIVGGVDCKVLKIVPDTEKFWEIVMNQSETFRELQSLHWFNNHSITNVSTTQWIANDTGFAQKSQTTLKTVMNLKDFDESDTDEEFTMTRDITMEMQFSDYNELDIPKGPL